MVSSDWLIFMTASGTNISGITTFSIFSVALPAYCFFALFRGEYRSRTDDLLLAKQAL
jgi:hypothetical protein